MGIKDPDCIFSPGEHASGLLSLPFLVERFRHNLSVDRPAQITWDEVVELGKRHRFDTNVHNFPEALQLLAQVWMKVVYPGTGNQRCIEFAQLALQFFVRGGQAPSSPSELQTEAQRRVYRILGHREQANLTEGMAAELALGSLVYVMTWKPHPGTPKGPAWLPPPWTGPFVS